LSQALPTAMSLRAGGITQKQNLVNVYFNPDQLNGSLATDPRFYQLIDTAGTLSTTDDTMRVPDTVVYDNVHHTAVLDFGVSLPTGTYKLRTGTSDESNNTTATALDIGRIHSSSPFTQLGFIGDAGGDQDFDLYKFEVQAGSTITATVTPGVTLNSALRLFDSTGTAVAFGNAGGLGAADTINFNTALGGTFYLGVSNSANVSYNALTGTGTTAGGTTGTYQLTVASNTAISGIDDNSSFATATQLGQLGRGGQSFVGQISPQSILVPPPAGGPDEPGHREIPAESHGVGPGTAVSTPGSLGVVRFHFPTIYGTDSTGAPLINQITEAQKTRAREIYEHFASLYGFEVAEGPGGTGIVTGDPRAVDPNIPPDAVSGIAGGGLALMNARSFTTPADDLFGGGWMGTALHEIGHTLGLLHSYEIRSVQGNGTAGEDEFPGNNDIVHGRRISPNDGSDIDLYQFSVTTTGTVSAEIVSERDAGMLNNGLLNSVLRLYKQNTDGTKTLVAQNDDYYSIDSFLKLELDPGTYFIGVTSTGNNDYDPNVSDTGFGGTSDGDYRLKLSFATESAGSLLDSTGERFDGDLDNAAGGTANEFAFRSNIDPLGTLYVDKSVSTNLSSAINNVTTAIPVTDASVFGATGGFQIRIENEVMLVNSITGNTLNVTRAQAGTTALSHIAGRAARRNPIAGTGTLANPFGLISDAIAAASAGNIIRIVGNGGADNDILTAQDNRGYIVGINDSSQTLEDGSTFAAPKNVVIQMDAGTVFKLNRAIIDAGSSAVGQDKSGGALQVLGTTKQQVYFTSHENDLIGGDSDGVTDGASAADWGGLVMRADSDFQAADAAANPDAAGIFLNYIAHADISFGGGLVTVNGNTSRYNSIHLVTSRPTVTHNTVRFGADAAMSANPDSFDDSRGRIGPELYGNTLFNNTFNGIFVRIGTSAGSPLERLNKTARFDDTDIVHLITENLEIVGNPGGPLNGTPRPSGRLAVDPGVVVKLGSSRIEGMRGSSHLIAEGTPGNPVIMTSINDDRYGAGGTFDSTNNGTSVAAAAGNWGGLMFNADSRLSVDNAYIAFAGGNIPIEGSFDNFNTIEVHHGANARVANTLFENNGAGGGGSRNGRGNSSASTIFVRQAQPIIVNNVFRNNAGAVIDINANAMLSTFQHDTGSSTGDLGAFSQFAGNQGPLVRLNRMEGNGVNGMNIRGDVLTTESVWDDTDIVHVLRSDITVDQHHTYSGLRLKSNPGESLVVKLLGANAGFTADGILLDIDDRIGGTVQIIGQPGFPVVLTSLNDDSVGASLDPNGFPQTDTDNDGAASPAAPGQWRSILFNKNSNDRNVRTEIEQEKANNGGIEINDNSGNAHSLGELATQHVTGPDADTLGVTTRINSDDNRPAGFEVHGYISADDPGDVDLYSFNAEARSEVWIDLDRTRGAALDPVVELVQADGTVLARARFNHTTGVVDITENFQVGDGGDADVLTKFPYDGGDFYTFNPYDTGFRVTLPGNPGNVNTYFVRVRSNQSTAADLDNIPDGGLTSGEYQLQVRLRQTDEKPGSVVRFADIRYATIGIEVNGLPAHSPLLAELIETTQGNGPNQTHQPLGNLLAADRSTISFGGRLGSGDDQDFYRYNSDYASTILGDSIQVIGGSSGGGKTWTTVFDLDYADGLSSADTTMIIYDANGRPILIGRESNIEDDRPAVGVGQGNDQDDLTRGSVGFLDPYIGPVQMPTGNPGSTTNYSVSVSSNAFVNTQLNQTYDASPANMLTRLEPVNSTTRIVEDHIGFQGYTSNGAAVDPTLTTGLFDITSATSLSTYVRPFDLGDVVLFTHRSDELVTINPLFGQVVTTVDTNVDQTDNGNTVQDLVMRSDGRLWAYRRSNTGGTNTNNGTAGALVEIDVGTGAFLSNANDGVGSGSPAANNFLNQTFNQVTNTDDVDALAWRRNATNNYDLFYSVRENGASATTTGATTFNSKLYRADPATGNAAINAGAGYGFRGDIQLAGTNAATSSITFNDGTNSGTISFETRAQGTQANGVRLVIQRTGGPTQVVGAANGVVTVNVNFNFGGPAGTTSIQTVVDTINASFGAQQIMTAVVSSGNAGTLVTFDATSLAATGGTDDASGLRVHGTVTGMAFGSFSGGTLFGVTSGEGTATRGSQLVSIDVSSGNATILRDFTSLGIGTTATNGFSGLALGPQNVEGGIYANTLFATTADGRMVALDALGNGVIAFDSNNEVQTVTVTGNQTALTANIAAAQTVFTVTDASIFPATPFNIRVDSEEMTVTNVAGNTLTVTRAVNSTVAATHLAAAVVFEAIPGSYYTLNFDAGTGSQTTDPIAYNAPGSVSSDETQTVDVVAYAGNYTLSFVNNLFDTTSPVSNITIGATNFQVEDATGLPASNFIIRVENEEMLVTSRVGTTLNVTRGIHGTTAAAHPQSATVFEVLTTNLNGALGAATNTTLVTAPIDNVSNPVVFDVADASAFPATPFFIRIDAEELQVTNVAGNTLTATRGANGTAIANHSVGATIAEINASQTINVVDVTSFPTAPFNIRIDNEDMRVTAVAPGQFTVTRGLNGTTMAAHSNGATVYRLVTTAAGALQYNSTLTDIDTALTTALNAAGITVAAGDIVTTVGPTGATPTGFFATPVSIQFTGSLGRRDLPALTGDTTNLVGDEQQSLTLSNTFNTNGTGTFTITFGASTTGPLAFNASAATVEAALDSLASIGGVGGDVTVSGTLPGTMTVTFGGSLQDFNVNTLVIDNTQLINNEIQRFQVNGAPTGGTFTLQLVDPANGYNPANIGPIAFNADQTTVQNAFDAALGAGVVTVSLSQPTLNTAGCVVTVTFDGVTVDDEDIASQMTVLTNALTGGTTPNVTLNTQVQGNLQIAVANTRQGSTVTTPVTTVRHGNLSVFDALAGLVNIGNNDIQVTGGDLPGNSVGVTFIGAFAGVNVNLMTVDNFGMATGNVAAVATTGTLGDGVADSFLVTVPGLNGVNGLAFSPLDFNLWHPTTRRGAVDVAGHGINPAYDNSRTPSNESRDIDDGQAGTPTDTQSEAEGGVSFYFGLEQYVDDNNNPYLNYEATRTQLGIRNNIFQQDLTSNANIIDNNTNNTAGYNLPGGAYGSLITNPFDLVSSAGATNRDRPVLYFNYFLETEDQNTNDPNGTMRDSARAFISSDGGLTWNLLATNNAAISGAGIASGNATSELPDFVSHSRLANTGEPRQEVQPLFDNTNSWRQARIDLSDYVNQTGLLLRFDFSTAGTILTTGFTSNDRTVPPAGVSLTTDVDTFGNLGDNRRGTNNNREGFYIDDIIIGWAERGEMITAAAVDQTYFQVPQPPTSLMLPQELLTGEYQVEIRRGFEYAGNVDKMSPDIAVANTFDTNVRFIPGSTLGLAPVSDDFEGGDTDLTTFGFNPAVGWIANAPGVSDSPWFVAPTPASPTTTLNNAGGGITAADNFMTVASTVGFPAAGTPFILYVGNEPMGAQVVFGNLLAIVRGPTATAHTNGEVVSFTTAAAQSSPITDNQTSVMQVTQITSGVSFRYKLTADVGDTFLVYLDQFAAEGGPTLQVDRAAFALLPKDADGFATVNLAFTPGTHTLFFAYQKDGTDGLDLILDSLEGAIIDDVVLLDSVRLPFVATATWCAIKATSRLKETSFAIRCYRELMSKRGHGLRLGISLLQARRSISIRYRASDWLPA